MPPIVKTANLRPKALAIETSGRIGSIAVIDQTAQIYEEQFEHGLQNAAKILPIIDRLLCARQMLANDLEEVYISIGPGSFTGLRIGVTIAKTLSLATGLKLVAVPTVRVLVENAPPEAKHVIIVLDAKRDQIFTARFERVGENWIEKQPAQVNLLAVMLENSPRPVHLLGEGIPYHEKFIPNDPQIIRTSPESWRARASIVAKLGMEMAARGEFTDPFKLIPTYIRKPEAEEKMEAQNTHSK